VNDSVIEHADALDWLAAREPGTATAVIYDPPYAVGTPVRGREDGAAGSVSDPLSFMQRTMSLCARALRPGGIVVIFGDYKRLPDLMYAATTSGLRLSECVAWVRTSPGTGRAVPVELGPDPDRLAGNARRRRQGSGQERDRDQ
jgi:DNA modification methylase